MGKLFSGSIFLESILYGNGLLGPIVHGDIHYGNIVNEYVL